MNQLSLGNSVSRLVITGVLSVYEVMQIMIF